MLGPYLAAAALLVVAGAAKARRPADTARALGALRHGVPLGPLAIAVPVAAAAEALLGAVALAVPHRPEATAVAASYAAFAAFVVVARRRGGVLATCGCFGTPDTPATRLHVVLDLLLAAAASVVAAEPPQGTTWTALAGSPLHGAVLLAGAGLLTALVLAAMTGLARLHATRGLLATPGPAVGELG